MTKRAPHWMGERDYARDLAAEENDRLSREQEDERERRAARRAGDDE